jgi:hypothetical protein
MEKSTLYKYLKYKNKYINLKKLNNDYLSGGSLRILKKINKINKYSLKNLLKL